MVDTEPVPPKGSPNAFPRRVVPTVAALATGSALGWFFRLELLKLLVDPWLAPYSIWERHPSSEEVAVWFRLIAATAGIVLALPWLTVLVGGLVSPTSGPISGRSGYGFIIWSYATIGIGLCLAAFVAFPAFLLRQRGAWHGMDPVPWAYVEFELGVTLGFALVCQMGAVLCALARACVVRRVHSDTGAQRTF